MPFLRWGEVSSLGVGVLMLACGGGGGGGMGPCTTGAVTQSGGTVTWTWAGQNTHNLTFSGGPTPQPANQANQVTGTAQRTLTTVGSYSYACTNHFNMNGTVRVVH